MDDTNDRAPRRAGPINRDMKAGAIFVAIALLFAFEARHYEMGRAIRMGAGFIPMALAILLGVMGLAVAFAARGQTDDTPPSVTPWRGILLVCLALAIFGAYGRGLGLVPTVFLCTLITALASTRNTILSSVATGAVLAALCWVVFKLGLGISLPTIGAIFGPLAVY